MPRTAAFFRPRDDGKKNSEIEPGTSEQPAGTFFGSAEPAAVEAPVASDIDAPLDGVDDADFSFLDAPSVPVKEPRADFSWLEEPAPETTEPEIFPEEAPEATLVAEDGGVGVGPAPEAPVTSDMPLAEEKPGEFDWLDAPLPPPEEDARIPAPPSTDVVEGAPDRIDLAAAGTGASPIPGLPPLPPVPPVTEGWRLRSEAEPAPAPASQARWIDRLRGGLQRSSGQLTGQITALFTKRRLDEATLQDFEDVLIQADLGIETSMRITERLSEGRFGREIASTEVRRILSEEIEKTLDPVALPLELDLSVKPHVILVVGVNGTGKTTTIGKLAAKLTRGGLKVTLAAGDTFRAAAVEQLKIWGERTGSAVVSKQIGADAAGLAFEAYETAVANGSDVLIVDTAGRLQNRAELMAELEKIVRVLGRQTPDAPHTVLQTLDATTGQNALNQVEIFRNVAGVNGLVMTKLDGTARGGILVAIAAKHRLPVFFVGVGEGIDDLEPFRAKDFADAIAGTT